MDAARRIYAGATSPRTGERIAPGLAQGSELSWRLSSGPGAMALADTYFEFVVFEDTCWDFRTFDFDRDLALAERPDDGLLDGTDPDLTEFASRAARGQR